MSSISPVVTKRLAALVAAKGGSMLDAPVSGGEIGAINATLSIMVGGDEAAFERARPILACMGNPESVIVTSAESGAGQVCKICNQIAIGGALAGVSEAFALAKKAGVDAARVRQALLGGFAGEPRARSPRRAHAHRQLQAGLPRAALPEGSAARERSRGGQRRRDAGDAIVTQLVNALVASGGGELDYSAAGDGVVRAVGGEAGEDDNVERRTSRRDAERSATSCRVLRVRSLSVLAAAALAVAGRQADRHAVGAEAASASRRTSTSVPSYVVVELLLVRIRHGRDVHALVAEAAGSARRA